jgi:hypothetical protein
MKKAPLAAVPLGDKESYAAPLSEGGREGGGGEALRDFSQKPGRLRSE